MDKGLETLLTIYPDEYREVFVSKYHSSPELDTLFSDPILFKAFMYHLQFSDMPENAVLHLQDDYDAYCAKRGEVLACVRAPEKRDARVATVHSIVQETLNSYDPFGGAHVAGVLTGSFYFGDPSTDPDLDIDFATDDADTIRHCNDFIPLLDDKVYDYAPKPFHSFAIDLSRHRKHLAEFRTHNYGNVLFDDDFIPYSSQIITSKIFIPRQSDIMGSLGMLRATRLEIDNLAQEHPVYRALIMHEWDIVIDDRKRYVRPVLLQESL
jgi:hypothetical protein